MSDISTTFQKALSTLLSENGMTQMELAAKLKVSPAAVNNWLLGYNMPRMNKIDAIAEIFSVSRSFLIGDTVDHSRYSLLPVTKRKIPVIGNVHCGDPVYADEEYLDIVDSDISADFALRVKGDSMTGAGITEGDIVFVRQQPVVENGELAVVLIGDEAAVKRVYKYETYISLNADNPAYAPIILREGDGQEASILGKVVAFTHYYKCKKE